MLLIKFMSNSLRWRHNGRDSVSNHQPHDGLLNRLFRRRSKKTSKLRVTGLCAGNSPGPVNSPHKGPVTRKMFPFDDVIMSFQLSATETPVMMISHHCCQATGHYPSQCWTRFLSLYGVFRPQCINTLRPRQNSWHFIDNIFKGIFLNGKI